MKKENALKSIIIIGKSGSGKTFLGDALEAAYKKDGLKVKRRFSGDGLWSVAATEYEAKKEGADFIIYELLELRHIAKACRRRHSLFRIIRTGQR